MAGLMFVSNARHGASPSYYTYNPQFDHIGGRLLFWLPPKILDIVLYFGLHKSARHMGTAPVLIALAFHR